MSEPFDGRDVLFKAAEWLNEPGRWIQGLPWANRFGHGIGLMEAQQQFETVSACAHGAISLWAHTLVDDWEKGEGIAEQAQALLRQTLNEYYPETGLSIIGFNDADERTLDEVVTVMRTAAS